MITTNKTRKIITKRFLFEDFCTYAGWLWKAELLSIKYLLRYYHISFSLKTSAIIALRCPPEKLSRCFLLLLLIFFRLLFRYNRHPQINLMISTNNSQTLP